MIQTVRGRLQYADKPKNIDSVDKHPGNGGTIFRSKK